MGRLLPNPEKNDWTIRFITDGRSGKVGDIRRAGKVGLIFQHDPDDAFVASSGRATLLQRESEVRRLWRDAFDAYFPTAADRANAAFVEVDIERMALWIRLSRQSHSDCCRQNLSGVKEAPGVRAIAMRRDPM
jgi:general stress protein 26